MGELKKVANFPTGIEADAAKAFLEANGIPATIENSFAGSILPHLTLAMGGFTVRVRAEDFERGLELLRADFSADLPDE